MLWKCTTFLQFFATASADLSLAVEAKNLVTDAWRSTGLDLVQMTEQIQSRPSPTVVQLALRQNSEDRALTSVHVTQHRKTKVNKLQCNKNKQ